MIAFHPMDRSRLPVRNCRLPVTATLLARNRRPAIAATADPHPRVSTSVRGQAIFCDGNEADRTQTGIGADRQADDHMRLHSDRTPDWYFRASSVHSSLKCYSSLRFRMKALSNTCTVW